MNNFLLKQKNVSRSGFRDLRFENLKIWDLKILHFGCVSHLIPRPTVFCLGSWLLVLSSEFRVPGFRFRVLKFEIWKFENLKILHFGCVSHLIPRPTVFCLGSWLLVLSSGFRVSGSGLSPFGRWPLVRVSVQQFNVSTLQQFFVSGSEFWEIDDFRP